MLNAPVQVRLKAETKAKYETAAANQQKSLSEYLRQRLEEGDGLLDAMARVENRLAAMQYQLENFSQAPSGEQGNVMLEMLLLLRLASKPENRKIVQAELKRHSMNPWGSEDNDD